MIEHFINGFIPLMHWNNILAIVGGSVVGYLVGALPGLSATMGIALCLPFTFYLPPLASLLFLTSLYGAAEYGGSITAVTLNIPGETAATPTTFDGYPLTQKGFPAKALGMSIVASFYAGIVSTIALILTAVPLASMALSFGPPEYFALGLFGLTAVAALAGKSWVKGCIGILFGLLINTIGIDDISGTSRYIFINALYEGLPLIPLLIGLFAISEVLMTMEELSHNVVLQKISGSLPTLKEYLSCHRAMVRGTLIGYVIGIIPGAGKAVASFIAYNEEKRASKHPELFGTGVLEGVAAPEAANNSIVSGALVPLLTLGIPGSAAAAVLIGAFTIQGLQPGPLLFVKQPELVYGLFAGLLAGNVVMLAMGLLGTQLWAKVLLVPKNILTPIVLADHPFRLLRGIQQSFFHMAGIGFRFAGVRHAEVRFSGRPCRSCDGFGKDDRNLFPQVPDSLGGKRCHIFRKTYHHGVIRRRDPVDRFPDLPGEKEGQGFRVRRCNRM